MSLWPPQLDLLNARSNPLDPAVKRLLLSFPTSAGKTLIAQYIIAAYVASGDGLGAAAASSPGSSVRVGIDLQR
jgi:hypothetical protein